MKLYLVVFYRQFKELLLGRAAYWEGSGWWQKYDPISIKILVDWGGGHGPVPPPGIAFGGDLIDDINNNTFVAIAESQEEPEPIPEETEEEKKERLRLKNNEKHKR